MKNEYHFSLENPVKYHWSGKFVGKDSNWKHMERDLLDYELIVMEKGILYIEDEWNQYEVKAGEYLLMEPTKCQRGYQPSKCSFYWMHFSMEESMKHGNIRIDKQGKLSGDERLFILLKQLHDTELRYLDTAYNTFLATGILYELSHQQNAFAQVEKEDNDLVKKVSDYVVEHCGENLKVAEIAQKCGYNEKYLSTAFRKKTGISVKQFIDQKKIERAKYLLLNTNAWVMEIADILGYENIQNFYHIFKKETECTPSEFRKIYGKKNEFDK